MRKVWGSGLALLHLTNLANVALPKTEDTRISKAQSAGKDHPSFQIHLSGFDSWFLPELLKFANWWKKKIFFLIFFCAMWLSIPPKVSACQPPRGQYWI
jgi:hypothetical protein